MTRQQLSRSIGVSEAASAFPRRTGQWRMVATAAVWLVPALLLAGCGASAAEKTMAEQLARAEAAADRAVKAQQAAEHAASAAGAPTQTFADDEAQPQDDSGEGDNEAPPPPGPPAPPDG
jgi:hypothetical protein